MPGKRRSCCFADTTSLPQPSRYRCIVGTCLDKRCRHRLNMAVYDNQIRDLCRTLAELTKPQGHKLCGPTGIPWKKVGCDFQSTSSVVSPKPSQSEICLRMHKDAGHGQSLGQSRTLQVSQGILVRHWAEQPCACTDLSNPLPNHRARILALSDCPQKI